MIDGAIEPFDDDTSELSMKAPMLVSKPADLGLGVPNCVSKANGNRRPGHDVYPGSVPLDGGNTVGVKTGGSQVGGPDLCVLG